MTTFLFQTIEWPRPSCFLRQWPQGQCRRRRQDAAKTPPRRRRPLPNPQPSAAAIATNAAAIATAAAAAAAVDVECRSGGLMSRLSPLPGRMHHVDAHNDCVAAQLVGKQYRRESLTNINKFELLFFWKSLKCNFAEQHIHKYEPKKKTVRTPKRRLHYPIKTHNSTLSCVDQFTMRKQSWLSIRKGLAIRNDFPLTNLYLIVSSDSTVRTCNERSRNHIKSRKSTLFCVDQFSMPKIVKTFNKERTCNKKWFRAYHPLPYWQLQLYLRKCFIFKIDLNLNKIFYWLKYFFLKFMNISSKKNQKTHVCSIKTFLKITFKNSARLWSSPL